MCRGWTDWTVYSVGYAKADIVRVTFYDNASLKAAVKVVMDIRCGEVRSIKHVRHYMKMTGWRLRLNQ